MNAMGQMRRLGQGQGSRGSFGEEVSEALHCCLYASLVPVNYSEKE